MTAAAALALFDLDGTLIDSAPDIAAAVDSALRNAGRLAIGEAVVRDYIGQGAVRLIHRAITALPDGVAEAADFARIYEDFIAAYAASLFERSRVYPGVTDALAELSAGGWRLGCVTNKPSRFSEPLLQAAGLARAFEIVLSGDSLPTKKPDPAPIRHAALRCGISLARTVMIGDSASDVGAARGAMVHMIAVDYGYSGGMDLAELGADAVVSSMSELPAVARRLVN